MRILLLSREFPPYVHGGVAYHAYNLARELVSLGHEIEVVTSKSEEQSIDDSDFHHDGISVSYIDYHSIGSPRLWFNRAVTAKLAELIDLRDVDLLHSHEFIDFDALEFTGDTILKVHVNLTERPMYTTAKAYPGPLRPFIVFAAKQFVFPRERALELRALRSADFVVYNSNLVRNIYRDYYGYEPDSEAVIYNGVDLSTFTPESARRDGFVLYVGGTSERKGFDVIEEALTARRRSDVLVVLAGRIDYDLTNRLQNTSNVSIVGRVDQHALVRLYRRAAVLVHPALYEPFGNVLLESIACGTPVICSNENHCGAAELLDDHVAEKIHPTPDALVGRLEDPMAAFDRSKFRASRGELLEGRTWRDVARKTIIEYRRKGS